MNVSSAVLRAGIGALLLIQSSQPLFSQESAPKPEPPKPATPAPMPQIKVDNSPLPAGTLSFAPVVEKVAPSVVTISTSKMVRGSSGPMGNNPLFNDPMFRRFFGIPEQDDDSAQEPPAGPNPGRKPNSNNNNNSNRRQALGLGSGVIVSSEGHILTNNHVIEGADDITVTIGNSTQEYKATKIGADPGTDIALLKIDGKDLPSIVFSDSDKLRPGDIVLAVGNPFGLTQSATMGVVSAISRGGMGIIDYENFIQTDASINMGNSGGALVDYQGRLVGINTAIFSRTGGNQGIGFAVPSNLARGVMESLLKSGRVVRGFLGVGLQPLSEELVQEFKLQAHSGALISEVQAGSPAEKAGVKTGDVISGVNGKKIESPRELQLLIGSLSPGSKAELKIVRDGEERSVSVDLGERPSSGGIAAVTNEEEPDVLDGVTVSDIDANVRKEFNIPESVKSGVVITQIDPDSPSATAGLNRGDVILEIDRQPATSASDAVALSEKLKKQKKVLLRISSRGSTRYIVVERK